MERKEVYGIIDTERDYQNAKFGKTLSSDRPGNGERTLDEFILYISVCSDKLAESCIFPSSTETKLASIRKVAALCVQCMEQHGGVERKQ